MIFLTTPIPDQLFKSAKCFNDIKEKDRNVETFISLSRSIVRLTSSLLVSIEQKEISDKSKLTLLLILGLFCYHSLQAQLDTPDHDTTYYRSFKGSIIGRTYFSRTYVHFNLNPPGNVPNMSYRAHTTLNLGLGITYRSLSFSYSKGLNFLHSNKTKGKTRSSDYQLHLYKRKWTIDALASFYRGFYLSPRGLGSPDNGNYLIRPDMKMQLFGASVFRVLNDRRFCYGAGLSQNAWQQKSAGSFLIGAQAFYLTMSDDSSFAPRKVDSSYYDRGIHKLHLLCFGPGIGYAYTLVVKQHYFILGSFNINMNLRYSREIGSNGGDKIGFSPNYLLRLGTGYTSNWWSLNFTWVIAGVNTQGKDTEYKYTVSTGNYRLVYARRFAINRKMKQIIGTP